VVVSARGEYNAGRLAETAAPLSSTLGVSTSPDTSAPRRSYAREALNALADAARGEALYENAERRWQTILRSAAFVLCVVIAGIAAVLLALSFIQGRLGLDFLPLVLICLSAGAASMLIVRGRSPRALLSSSPHSRPSSWWSRISAWVVRTT